MTNAPNNLGPNGRYYREGMAEGMAHHNPYNPSMAGLPPNYTPPEKNIDEKDKEGDGLFINLFLQGYARRLEQELQYLALAKTDLTDSAKAKTDFSYFLLFFRALGNLLSIGSLIGFLSLLFFALFAKISNYIIAGIASFLFLQLLLFPYAAIIYSFEKYRIGKQDTGKFINTVKAAWHTFEIKYIIIMLLFFLPYYSENVMVMVSSFINNLKFDNPIIEKVWITFIHFANFQNWHEALFYYLISLFIFLITYVIGIIIVILKAKKEREKNVFNLSKEFKLPFELIREKFKDIA